MWRGATDGPFFDVGQGLSAVVKLPDRRNILVDAGESPTRPGCGAPCKDWNARLLAALPTALGSFKIGRALDTPLLLLLLVERVWTWARRR